MIKYTLKRRATYEVVMCTDVEKLCRDLRRLFPNAAYYPDDVPPAGQRVRLRDGRTGHIVVEPSVPSPVTHCSTCTCGNETQGNMMDGLWLIEHEEFVTFDGSELRNVERGESGAQKLRTWEPPTSLTPISEEN